jgi:hypothetical protein
MVRFGFTAVPLRTGRYALLLSTDVALSAQAIYCYGKARFQVECCSALRNRLQAQ